MVASFCGILWRFLWREPLAKRHPGGAIQLFNSAIPATLPFCSVKMQSTSLKVATGVVGFVTLAASFVSVIGIADQLRFTQDHRCLLFVDNYHKVTDGENYMYLFDSFSQACNGAVSVGSIGLFFMVVFFAVQLYFNRAQRTMSKSFVNYTVSIYTLIQFLRHSGLLYSWP